MDDTTETPPLAMRPEATARQRARFVRRWQLARRLGDTTVLHGDGTRTVYRGQRGWRRAWLKLRMWFA